MSNLKQLDY